MLHSSLSPLDHIQSPNKQEENGSGDSKKKKLFHDQLVRLLTCKQYLVWNGSAAEFMVYDSWVVCKMNAHAGQFLCMPRRCNHVF